MSRIYFTKFAVCQSGGAHDFDGSDYSLVKNMPNVLGQTNWHWCKNCYQLAYHDGSRPPGRCPAGGQHDHSMSSSYVIPNDTEASTWAVGMEMVQELFDSLLFQWYKWKMSRRWNTPDNGLNGLCTSSQYNKYPRGT